jgi:xanthine dehydrogenase accessory factor
MRPVVVVAGSGDVGSAVAVVLHRAGFATIVCDDVDPPWIRRGMTFTDAWYVGTSLLEEATAVFCSSVKSVPAVIHGQRLVGATTWSWAGVAASLQALAIVDARMRKRSEGDDLRGRVPPGLLTIGVGPGYVAGGNVDIAIESAWGECLGTVVAAGPTLPFAGEPRLLGGAGRERFVYAPCADRFATGRRIGERVTAGQVVGALGNRAILAPLPGVLRGLAANGARVPDGAKLVEVDPQGDPALCFGLGERPRAIACGVLDALAMRGLAAVKPASPLLEASRA